MREFRRPGATLLVDDAREWEDAWFWEPGASFSESPIGQAVDGTRRHRTDAAALGAAVAGALGLAATWFGQTRHVDPLTDLVVVVVALGGTLAAVVAGHVGLLGLATTVHPVRTLCLGLVGLALAGGSLLTVVALGLSALAG
ncbi:MAG: hypothetical protein IE926_02320 [Micrococcales bacterium]|nr:hypothetical protein [Micrococcales bacterium]